MAVKKNVRSASQKTLLGHWKEHGSGDDTTPLRYSIAMKDGIVSVAGVDQSDGTVLKISRVRLIDGMLRFDSFYPPAGHKASHEFVVCKKGRAMHKVSYSDEDGRHQIEEIWEKIG